MISDIQSLLTNLSNSDEQWLLARSIGQDFVTLLTQPYQGIDADTNIVRFNLIIKLYQDIISMGQSKLTKPQLFQYCSPIFSHAFQSKAQMLTSTFVQWWNNLFGFKSVNYEPYSDEIVLAVNNVRLSRLYKITLPRKFPVLTKQMSAKKSPAKSALFIDVTNADASTRAEPSTPNSFLKSNKSVLNGPSTPNQTPSPIERAVSGRNRPLELSMTPQLEAIGERMSQDVQRRVPVILDAESTEISEFHDAVESIELGNDGTKQADINEDTQPVDLPNESDIEHSVAESVIEEEAVEEAAISHSVSETPANIEEVSESVQEISETPVNIEQVSESVQEIPETLPLEDTQEIPSSTQEIPESTQEVSESLLQDTQEIPESTQEIPASIQPSSDSCLISPTASTEEISSNQSQDLKRKSQHSYSDFRKKSKRSHSPEISQELVSPPSSQESQNVDVSEQQLVLMNGPPEHATTSAALEIPSYSANQASIQLNQPTNQVSYHIYQTPYQSYQPTYQTSYQSYFQPHQPFNQPSHQPFQPLHQPFHQPLHQPLHQPVQPTQQSHQARLLELLSQPDWDDTLNGMSKEDCYSLETKLMGLLIKTRTASLGKTSSR